MRDEDKTHAQLIAELHALRKRNEELEASEEQLRLTEEAFWESEQRFRIIVDNAYDGICICEHDDRIKTTIRRLIYCNERYVQQSGYDRLYLRNLETIDEVVTHHLTEEEEKENDQCLQNHEPCHGVSSWNRTDSRENFHEWVSVPITIEDGLFSVSILRDITERRRTEQERVRLERLSALGEMAAGVSHNLNNILMGVLGPSQLLLQKVETPEIRQQLDLIVTSADRAAGLVQRIYHAVRGNEEEPCHPVEINTVIPEAIASGQPRWKDQAQARGITVQVLTNLAQTPPIHGTKTQFHNLILNLLFNACDAMHQSGQITIETVQTEDAVKLYFSDTGAGMPENVRKRIFEPFFTTKEDIGTGLGLATVYTTIKGWGGDVTVDSTEGQGTCFTLTLPFWSGDVATEEIEETNISNDSVSILIVDDDDIVLQFLQSFLNPQHTVTVTKHGEEALNLAQQNSFDLALLDLGMPGMSGDQIAQQLKKHDPALITVLITGWELADSDPRLAPFDFKHQKPLRDLQGFQTLISRAITERKIRQQTQQKT